jgi:hypothetical protein
MAGAAFGRWGGLSTTREAPGARATWLGVLPDSRPSKCAVSKIAQGPIKLPNRSHARGSARQTLRRLVAGMRALLGVFSTKDFQTVHRRCGAPLKERIVLASFCRINNYRLSNFLSTITDGRPHRRLGSQIFDVTGPAVHTGPSPLTVWPVATGLTRISVALPASRSRNPPRLPYPACRLETHNKVRSMYGTRVHGARNARGADRFAPRRSGARVLGFQRWLPFRQFCALAIPPLRTRLDRNKRAGSTRGEARFAPGERAPARFSGRCWPVRFCGLPRSCVCWS